MLEEVCHHPHPESAFLFSSLGKAGSIVAQAGQPPQGGMIGQPPMPGQPATMLEKATWLMKNRNMPAFSPPAPSEAAASWANHASIANDKAQDALMDILRIKSDALDRINTIAAQGQKVMEKAELTRENMVNDFNKEAVDVYNNFTAAKEAVSRMMKMAETQLVAAKRIAAKTDDASRVLENPIQGNSTAVAQSSFADKAEGTSGVENNAEIEPILDMIRKYMASVKSGEKSFPSLLSLVRNRGDPLASVVSQASAESSKLSSDQLAQNAKTAEEIALQSIGDARREADVKAFNTRLSFGTIMHDTAAAVSAALKSAKDLSQSVVMKELNAEKEILTLLREAQQTSLDAANEASKAETIARRAADFANQMAGKAAYAQNAAGQAMAAQMAQAMGYPVSVHGTPSPFPPFQVQQASVDGVACLMLVAQRRAKLGDYI